MKIHPALLRRQSSVERGGERGSALDDESPLRMRRKIGVTQIPSVPENPEGQLPKSSTVFIWAPLLACSLFVVLIGWRLSAQLSNQAASLRNLNATIHAHMSDALPSRQPTMQQFDEQRFEKLLKPFGEKLQFSLGDTVRGAICEQNGDLNGAPRPNDPDESDSAASLHAAFRSELMNSIGETASDYRSALNAEMLALLDERLEATLGQKIDAVAAAVQGLSHLIEEVRTLKIQDENIRRETAKERAQLVMGMEKLSNTLGVLASKFAQSPNVRVSREPGPPTLEAASTGNLPRPTPSPPPPLTVETKPIRVEGIPPPPPSPNVKKPREKLSAPPPSGRKGAPPSSSTPAPSGIASAGAILPPSLLQGSENGFSTALPRFTNVMDMPLTDGHLRSHWLLVSEECAPALKAAESLTPNALHSRFIGVVTSEWAGQLGLNGSCPAAVCLTRGVSARDVLVDAVHTTDELHHTEDDALTAANIVTWAERQCQKVHLGFRNEGSTALDLYWIRPEDGARVHLDRLAADLGKTHWRDTMLGHEFEVEDPITHIVVRRVHVEFGRAIYTVPGSNHRHRYSNQVPVF
eukprot:scaffold37285_cov32-Tisochrysis_lutea.AAC.1